MRTLEEITESLFERLVALRLPPQDDAILAIRAALTEAREGAPTEYVAEIVRLRGEVANLRMDLVKARESALREEK